VIVSAHDGYPRWLSSGADYIEIDIRRTPEGAIVLSHDELTPGAKHVALDEVLDAAGGRIGLQLDLKEPGYELDLVGRALQRCPAEKLAVTTDMAESLRIIKDSFPAVRTGLTARRIEPTTADFIALDQRYANDGSLNGAVPIWLWTVDDRRLIERYVKDPRVAGIITNRPDLALRLRSARS
jgi:glycerophosphoryl diester phosphodiesterase